MLDDFLGAGGPSGKRWLWLLIGLVALVGGLSVQVRANPRYLPLVSSSATTIPLPATLEPPPGYRCFAATPSWEQAYGRIYYTCNLNMPDNGPKGAALFAWDGAKAHVVFVSGVDTGPGLVKITQGELWFSFIAQADRRQVNLRIPPP